MGFYDIYAHFLANMISLFLYLHRNTPMSLLMHTSGLVFLYGCN